MANVKELLEKKVEGFLDRSDLAFECAEISESVVWRDAADSLHRLKVELFGADKRRKCLFDSFEDVQRHRDEMDLVLEGAEDQENEQ